MKRFRFFFLLFFSFLGEGISREIYAMLMLPPRSEPTRCTACKKKNGTACKKRMSKSDAVSTRPHSRLQYNSV